MSIDIDHFCSKCGSVLEAAIEVTTDSDVVEECHSVIVKVRPCNRCVLNEDLPKLISGGSVTQAEEIARLRAEISNLRAQMATRDIRPVPMFADLYDGEDGS